MCAFPCSECSGSATDCTECHETTFSYSEGCATFEECNAIPGKFANLLDMTCADCLSPCDNCSSQADNCSSCDYSTHNLYVDQITNLGACYEIVDDDICP